MRASDIVGWTDFTENGSTVRWKIDSDGTLVIEPLSGTTGVLDYSGYPLDNKPYYPPWHSNASSITSFGVSDGCTIECRNSLEFMFDECDSLASLDLTGLDTSAVTGMCCAFCECHSLASLDLTGLDTFAVTDMCGMFSDCSSLATIDLSGLDTSAVTDMCDMFSGCMSLTSLDLSRLNTSAVTEMGGMFAGCSALISLDVSGLDTSRVEEMYSMFDKCHSLASLDLSTFDTSRVGEMSYMFSGCSSLASLDLSSFDMSRATSVRGMFSGDQSLREVRLGGAFGFVAGETSTVLPDPRGDGYTGRWVRVSPDGSYVGPAYTPEELRDRWAPELAGTWVWEQE